jgi:hypothetical protein
MQNPPDWESFHLQFVPQKTPMFDLRSGFQYGAATEAAESLLAQIDSYSRVNWQC